MDNRKKKENTFELLGNQGPIILLLLTIIILIITGVPKKNKRNLVFFGWYTNEIKIIFVFLVGYYLNIIINKILKKYINDKRPFIKPIENRMPSGHSQLMFYIFGFIYFISYSKKIYISNINYLLLIYSFFIMNTIYNSIKYNYHTVDQVIIGGILGLFISYLTFLLYNI